MRTVALVVVVTTACTHLGIARPVTNSDAAIRAQIAAAERTWNARDAAVNVALFTETGDLILPGGPRHAGRAAIRQAWEAGWAAIPPDRKIALTVDAIRYPTPDVAIAEVSARFSVGQPERDRATYVMVRRGGQWFVEALRVMPAEQR